MPLKKTLKLLEQYQSKAFSDKDIQKLFENGAFNQSPGYRDRTKPLSESNHTAYEEMQDFVLALGAKLDEKTFHALTERFIRLAPDTVEENTYMRRNTIDKVLLAYELAKYPNSAQLQLEGPRVTNELPSQSARDQFKQIILEPLARVFRAEIANKEVSHVETQAAKSSMTDKLANKFKEFKKDLKDEIQDIKAKLTGSSSRAKEREAMLITRTEDKKVDKKADMDPFKGSVLEDEDNSRSGPRKF